MSPSVVSFQRDSVEMGSGHRGLILPTGATCTAFLGSNHDFQSDDLMGLGSIEGL